ncbi:unnamed protein product, partial [Sphacelaria rigidula]
ACGQHCASFKVLRARCPCSPCVRRSFQHLRIEQPYFQKKPDIESIAQIKTQTMRSISSAFKDCNGLQISWVKKCSLASRLPMCIQPALHLFKKSSSKLSDDTISEQE